MTIDQQNPADDFLEIATCHLRESRATVELSPDLIRRTVAAMHRAPRRKSTRAPLALMAASLLLIIAAASWFLFHDSAQIAFADVVQQVRQTKSFQATIIQTGDGRDPHESARISSKGSHGRFDTDDGLIVIEDDNTGDTMTLDPKAHVATRGKNPTNAYDIYAQLREIAAQTPKSIGNKVFAGRTLIGFAGTITLMGKPGVTATVWVDPKSKLPARIELSLKPSGPPDSVLDDIKFDVPLDDVLFDMTLPKGYELRDTLPARDGRMRSSIDAENRRRAATRPTPETIIPLPATPGPAPTAAELQNLILKPGIGIGDLKLGATRTQVEAAFGPPQGLVRVGAIELLQYSATGLTLDVDPKAGLQMIIAQGQTAPNPRMRSFPGQTDKQIHIGSKQSEIESAYGKDYFLSPVREDDRPEINQSMLIYSRLGLWLTINTNTKSCTQIAIGARTTTAPSTNRAK